MFLPKVNSSRPFHLWKTYSAWFGFCICVLILTNAFSSLTLIREYRFSLADVLLTYGFLIFWGILEAAVFALVTVVVEVLLEKIINKRLDSVFRFLLLSVLAITWMILFKEVVRFLFR